MRPQWRVIGRWQAVYVCATLALLTLDAWVSHIWAYGITVALAAGLFADRIQPDPWFSPMHRWSCPDCTASVSTNDAGLMARFRNNHRHQEHNL